MAPPDAVAVAEAEPPGAGGLGGVAGVAVADAEPPEAGALAVLADAGVLLAALPDAVLAAAPVAPADADADALRDPGAEPLVGAGAAASGPWMTGRKRSCAVVPSWRACSPLSPGTEMMMFELPWVITSAPATPRPFTRCSMIWRASSRSAWDGALPVGVFAVSVTVVPPRRSSPSSGVRELPVKKISAYMTTINAASTAK